MDVTNCTPCSHFSSSESIDTTQTLKIVTLATSIIIGAFVAYGATLPTWDKPTEVITNVGIIFSFWVMASWGSKMFFDKVIDLTNEMREVHHSCLYTSFKVFQVFASVILSLLAQVAYASMANEFHGPAWGWTILFLGALPITYSIYCFIDAVENYVTMKPSLRCEAKKKNQLMVMQEATVLSHNILKNTRRSQHVVRSKILDKLVANHDTTDTDRVSDMFNYVHLSYPTLLAPPPQQPMPLTVTRTIIRVIPTLLSTFYLYQLFLLAKDGWDDLSDKKKLNTHLSTPAVTCNIYYVMKACMDGAGHIFDQVCDALGIKRLQSINEQYLPKISRVNYLLGALFAILPQYQTVVLCDQYYPVSSLFGKFFLAGSITGLSLYIYNAMRELTDVALTQYHHLGSEELQVVSKLHDEIQQNILRIENFSYDELIEMCQKLTPGMKSELLANVDIEELEGYLSLKHSAINV